MNLSVSCLYSWVRKVNIVSCKFIYLKCICILERSFNFNFFLFLADILDEVATKFHELGLTYECVGGGRIKHDNKAKTIYIYGYSVVRKLCIRY